MELTSELLIALALVIVLGVVVFFEWRYLRSKREGKMEAALIQDEAYNSITTAKAIAESLRNQGRDVKDADLLILQAESAYSRRGYRDASELADKAKNALKFSKPSEDLVPCAAPTKKEDAPLEEECVPVLQSAKKLPPNYLESKFVLECVKSKAEGSSSPHIEEIRQNLAAAQERFDKEDYGGALKYGMRAKRLLEGESTEKVEKAAPVPPVTTTVKLEHGCTKCGAGSREDDLFCPECGARQHSAVCPACSSEVLEGDKFCRKCGAKTT